ncbi:MAG: hypothetical protein IJR77_06735 [Bacteroidales bacterium]|nr:hypothetical protein [Bacteroidales bacterium]
MRNQNYVITYLVMVVAQILLCNYLHLGPYVTVSILPALILCLPIRTPAPLAMVIAFATGLAVDFLAEGLPGINAFSLVPVALLRIPVISLVFGEDMISRKEEFSARRNGFGKTALAIIMVQALFLLLYIAVDGAGTRSFGFNTVRFVLSLAAGVALSLLLIDTIAPEARK